MDQKNLMNDIDERGDLKEWFRLAKDKRKWTKMSKERFWVEKGHFEETDDGPIDFDNANANRDESANAPRRQPSTPMEEAECHQTETLLNR